VDSSIFKGLLFEVEVEVEVEVEIEGAGPL